MKLQLVSILACVLIGLTSCNKAQVSHPSALPPHSSVWYRLQPFPTPAPRASADFTLSDRYFVNARGPTTLGNVADKLRTAIETAGYQSHRFMPAKDGFALVTEFEKISEDGKPDLHQRFNVNLQTSNAKFFSLSDYLKALLTADVGHYRVFVFIVTSDVVAQTDKGTTPSALEDLQGTDVLPPEVRAEPYVPASGSHCTVLVYEFEKPQNGDASLLTPSPVGGRDQLATAGILDQLSK